MDKKLNILQVYDYMELGGAETHIISLSKELIELGHVVWLMSSRGPAIEWVKNSDINFIEVPLDKKNELLTCIVSIIETIRKYNIDIIHVHPFNSQIACALANVATKIPVVTTTHSKFIGDLIKNEFRNQFSNFIAVSEEVKKFMLSEYIPESKIKLLPNSVPILAEITNKCFFNEKSIKISYISRISADKFPSIEFFIKSIGEIAKDIPVQVKLVGQGDKLTEVSKIVDMLNKEIGFNTITIVPGSIDIKEEVNDSDIIIGVGRVILEAISMGKFAICIGNTNYVGIVNKEILMQISKVNFTDRNSTLSLKPENLKHDILELYNNFENRFLELVDTYNFLLNNYSIDISARKHIEMYYETIKNFVYYPLGYNSDILGKLSIMNLQLANILRIYSEDITSKYTLDNPKDNKIFINPALDDPNDLWPIALNELISNLDNSSPVTIIIRIEPKFEPYLEDIIEQIEMVLNGSSQLNLPDLLLETKPMDDFDEMMFISTMNAFIPTNPNQGLLEFKCRLKEIIIFEVDEISTLPEKLF